MITQSSNPFAAFVPAYAADQSAQMMHAALQHHLPAVVITGPSGSGKSLLCSCAYAAALGPTRPVRLFTAVEFARLCMGRLTEIHDTLESESVLIIDDVHHVLRLPTAANAFAEALQSYAMRRGTVIVASEHSPYGIAACAVTAKAEISNRLNDAICVSLDPPGREARQEIVGRRCAYWRSQSDPVDIPDDVAAEIAAPPVTPRSLISAVDHIAIYAAIQKKSATIDMLELARVAQATPPRISIEDIMRAATGFYKLDLSDMFSEARNRFIARPRQVEMYLARKLTTRSLPEIGRLFGNRDHTTVLHACKRVTALMAEDYEFAREVDFLINLLNTKGAAPIPHRGVSAGSTPQHASGAPFHG